MALLQGQEQLKEAMEGKSLWIIIKAVIVTTTRKQHVIPNKPHFRHKIYSWPLMTPTELQKVRHTILLPSVFLILNFGPSSDPPTSMG